MEQAKAYAGFWIRLGAVIIDSIITMFVLYFPLMMIYGPEYWSSNAFLHGTWDLILNYIVPPVVTILLWRRFCATPGKMVTSVRIVDAKSGQPISIGQGVIRYLAYALSALPVGLGFIWAAFDKRKQGWHDKLAGTVVIRS